MANEQLNLTAPDQGAPGTPWYRPHSLVLAWADRHVSLRVIGEHDEFRQFDWYGDAAVTLMQQFNTMNFSTMSLWKRCLQKLVSDGLLSGTVA